MKYQKAEAIKILKVSEKVPDRFTRIRDLLMSEPVWLCPERALLITEFFKKHDEISHYSAGTCWRIYVRGAVVD